MEKTTDIILLSPILAIDFLLINGGCLNQEGVSGDGEGCEPGDGA